MDEQVATASFYDALAAFRDEGSSLPGGRRISYDRDADWVDDYGSSIAKALLQAGWTPPSTPPVSPA